MSLHRYLTNNRIMLCDNFRYQVSHIDVEIKHLSSTSTCCMIFAFFLASGKSFISRQSIDQQSTVYISVHPFLDDFLNNDFARLCAI